MRQKHTNAYIYVHVLCFFILGINTLFEEKEVNYKLLYIILLFTILLLLMAGSLSEKYSLKLYLHVRQQANTKRSY